MKPIHYILVTLILLELIVFGAYQVTKTVVGHKKARVDKNLRWRRIQKPLMEEIENMRPKSEERKVAIKKDCGCNESSPVDPRSFAPGPKK